MAANRLRVIEFKSPPPKRAAVSEWQRELEMTLKQNPGKWALVAQKTYPAKAVRYRKDPEYEVRTVYISKNVVDLYIRYIGPKKLEGK